MKKLFSILAAGAFAVSAQTGRAALLMSDPFDYAAGTLQSVAAANWTVINTGDTINVVDGNLSVSGLAASSGRSVSYGGAGMDYNRTFTTQTAGSTYFSFAVRVDSLGSLNTTGGYTVGLQDSSASSIFGASIWMRLSGAGFNIGINPRTTAANTVWGSTVFNVGDTIFLVGRYDIVSGAANDSVSLWLNPDSSTFAGSAPSPTLTAVNTGTDLANVNRIFLRQDSTGATPGGLTIDEMRVADSWADVTPVPEPTTWAGLIFGAIFCGTQVVRRLRNRQAAQNC